MWRLADAAGVILIGAVLLSVAIAAGVRPAAAQATPVATDLPGGDGAELVRARCLTCHGSDLIRQQRLSREGWQREVNKMVGWGATLADSEEPRLLAYLAQHFGRAASLDPDGADAQAILKARCLTCHDSGLIAQQRLTVAGWGRVIDKMIGWGAVVTPQQRDALAAHLSVRSGPDLTRKPNELIVPSR